MRVRQALSGMACLLLCACAAPVMNVALVSVAAFDGKSGAEAGRAFNRPYLKVQFTTDHDLRDYAIREAAVLSAHVDFCSSISRSGRSRLQYSPDIYDSRGVVNAYSLSPSPRQNYSVYVSVASMPLPDQPYTPYDLRQSPVDICFLLNAESALSYPVASNTIVIPAAQVAAALSAR